MSAKKVAIIRTIVYLCLITGLVVGGILATRKIANSQRNHYFEHREYHAAAAIAGINHKDVESLKGNETDIDTPAFERLREHLIQVKETDDHIRFVYLMRPQKGELIFLVDAEDPDSEDYSPPGQVYEEAKPEDFLAFEGEEDPVPVVEGPVTDRWGTWISASAYILNDKGEPVALLGTDVGVDKALASYDQIINLGMILTILCGVLLCLVALQRIFWGYYKNRREARRREMEEGMMRLNRELLEADRLKSEFVEMASHELRGPVTAIDSALKVMELRLKPKLDESDKECLEVASIGSRRLTDLANNLMDLTRMEAGHFKLEPNMINIGTLVEDTVKGFEALAGEKELGLSTRLPEEELTAFMDPQAVRRILENLLSNAIKYTDSGEITVEVKPTDDRMRFTVRDTGRGIPEKSRDDVFERFSRAHLSTIPGERGAGLGLAICKGVVEALGGKIWVESEEGKGSAFHFEIPWVREGNSGKSAGD